MRKRSRHTHQQIILAARQLFLERGYTAATMEAIAVRANVTKQTLYGYFADKRALFIAVIEDVMGGPWEIKNSADAITDRDDLRNALLRIGRHIDDVIAEPDYIELLRVIIAETIAEPGLGRMLKRGVTASALHSLTTLFSIARKSNLITIEHPGIAAQQFMGGFVTRIYLQGLLMQSGKKYIRRQSKSELSRYIDEFMKHIA